MGQKVKRNLPNGMQMATKINKNDSRYPPLLYPKQRKVFSFNSTLMFKQHDMVCSTNDPNHSVSQQCSTHQSMPAVGVPWSADNCSTKSKIGAAQLLKTKTFIWCYPIQGKSTCSSYVFHFIMSIILWLSSWKVNRVRQQLIFPCIR